MTADTEQVITEQTLASPDDEKVDDTGTWE